MVDAAYRRTVEELLARYALEPSLRDVYVEGPSDSRLLTLGFEATGNVHKIRAYEIDTVDVPAAALTAEELRVGCKGRIVALAALLGKAAPLDLRQNVVCLADADLDALLGRTRDLPLIVYTSGASLDSVLAEESLVHKLLTVVLLGFPLEAAALLDQLRMVLTERLLHRIAMDRLGITVPAPPLKRLCTFDGTRIVLRAKELIRRQLQKAKASHQEARFWEIVGEYRERLGERPSQYLPMDDFCEVLHICVHSVKPKHVPDADRFRRFLFGLVDGRAVAELPEVREIQARLSGAAV